MDYVGEWVRRLLCSGMLAFNPLAICVVFVYVFISIVWFSLRHFFFLFPRLLSISDVMLYFYAWSTRSIESTIAIMMTPSSAFDILDSNRYIDGFNPISSMMIPLIEWYWSSGMISHDALTDLYLDAMSPPLSRHRALVLKNGRFYSNFTKLGLWFREVDFSL